MRQRFYVWMLRHGWRSAWVRRAKRGAAMSAYLAVLLLGVGLGTARADDGGFWDWLERQSGPKMMGLGTDIHAVCLDRQHKSAPCEAWFGLKRSEMPFVAIRHEFDVRVAYYRSHGSRFEDVVDTRPINAVRVSGLYHYHVNSVLELGAGAGVMPYYGAGFNSFTVPVLTPASLVIAPFTKGALLQPIALRIEESYLATALTGARYNNSATSYNVPHGEWNLSIGVVYDFRRMR